MRSQTGIGPQILESMTVFLSLKVKYITLKQQPPLILPITGIPLMKTCETVWRWPCTTPWIVPAGRALISSVISSSSAHWGCGDEAVHMPQSNPALHWLPTWLTMIIAFAPFFFNFADYSSTICLYYRNLYLGNRPLAKAAVVEGVSVVASPITPILTPLANAYICDDACFGKKSLSSLSDLRLAAMLGASLADMKGNRKVGPKSNSWLPIADPCTQLSPQKSFIILPELMSLLDSIPP